MTIIRSRDDVLPLLVHLGYLAYNSLQRCVYIPNEEVREEFIRALRDYGGDILLVSINYDVKSKKHNCRIEQYTSEMLQVRKQQEK